MEKKITLPISKEVAKSLTAGESVLLTGDMLVFRDAGHKRLFESIKAGKPDIDYKGETIYFMGPCPAMPGQVMGSCGPTTSGRCDAYTPLLLQKGLKGMVGKGWRNEKVIEEMKKQKAVYFAAVGGAGALYADCVKEAKLIAFEDLGAEALYLLTVKDFPAIVAVDSKGNSVYKK